MAPLLIAEPIGRNINLYFLSFFNSNDYNLYQKIEENKKKYEEQFKKYGKYLEEINKENARKIIDENLKLLPELKETIFNKRITDDNHKDLLEFENTIKRLSGCYKYMTWEEINYYREFEKYLSLRVRQFTDGHEEHKNRNYSEKEREEVIPKEIKDMGNNTEKITIDELGNSDNKDTEDDKAQRTFEGKKVDFEEVSKENISLGLKGEKVIIDYEKEILIRNKRSDLAERIKHVSEEEGAGTGYDILSFDFNGNRKYIEVKTTKGNKGTPFILSENEVAFMEHEPEHCCIYRLYNFDDQKEIGNLITANGHKEIMDKFNLKASQYKARIK